MQKITFQDAEVVKAPYVLINGVEYPVIFETEGGTDLDAETFNGMQANIESAINSKQNTLIDSGTGQNIKTVNNNSLLGSGNININTIIGNSLSIQTETINCGTFPANYDKYDQEYSVTIPSGYKCLGIVGWYLEGPGYTNIFTNKLYYNSNKIYWSLKNSSSISLDIAISLYVKLLLVKTS